MAKTEWETATLPLAPVRPVSVHRAWCVERGHPGTTYNPLMDRTWCACGEVITDGDTATHALCCGRGV
jgi:hypothetical protein